MSQPCDPHSAIEFIISIINHSIGLNLALRDIAPLQK
jgi:hypothetical protein